MKVLYDHQIFEYQKTGGISRYFTELFSHFPNSVECINSIKFSNNTHLIEREIFPINPIVDYKAEFLYGFSFRGKGRLLNVAKHYRKKKYPNPYNENLKHSIKLLKNQNFDLFHPTFYSDYFLEYIGEKPFVITVHDLTYEIYPEFCVANDWVLLKMKALVEKANHIIAISENTKRDIMQYYHIDEQKISVVYHGVNLPIASQQSKKIEDRYLLFVGARIGYKNFIYFVRSIAKLLLKENVKLVCTGTPFSFEEKELFRHLQIENKVVHYFASDKELFSLYHKAIAFVFPSLYEGFGMPILEAFACDCPVVLSNTSCFPEIASYAALYFNPKNNNEIVEKIDALINNETLRQQLIAKGRERVKFFSWEKAAAETMNIYQSIV